MHSSFFIEDFLVEPRLNRVSRQGTVVQLAPKFMQVLVCLAEAGGEVVTREELMDKVWQETVVTEESLTRAISSLRSLFDDSTQSPKYIETIRGRGYRLLPAVTRAEKASIETHPPQKQRSFVGRWWAVGVGLAMAGLALWSFAFPRVVDEPFASAYQARPLTSFPGLEIDPALSPDGRQVVFASGATEDSLDLFIKTVGEETLVHLTKTPFNERRPAWSPDGEKLAFVQNESGCEVMMVPVQGGNPERLTTCTSGTMPSLDWSPDGNSLVWGEREANTSYRLVSFDLQAQTKTILTEPPGFFLGDGYPTYAPDGNSIAFVRTQAFGIQDLYLYDLVTGSTSPLTSEETKIGGLTWAPDGEGLFFSSKRSGFYGLWYVPRSGGSPQWANAIYENIHYPSMALSGSQRVYERRIVDTNIWRLPLKDAPADAEEWIASTLWDGYPAISPDGRQLAFASDRSGSPEIWLTNLEGGNLRKLTGFDGPFIGSPQWAPGGKTIVFEARAHGNADLYQINLETGTQERLTTHAANDVTPRWSHDGKSLYFGSNREAGWQLWKKSLIDGTLHQVTSEGGYVGMESVDGKSFYYVKHDAPGLWQQALDGGASTRVLDNFSPSYANSWMLSEAGVFFIQQTTGEPARLSFFDFDSRQVTSLTTPENPVVASGLAISPGIDHLYFVQVDRNESDIIIEEPFVP